MLHEESLTRYIADERPVPGDIIELATSKVLRQNPMHNADDTFGGIIHSGDGALVIALWKGKFLDWMLVLTFSPARLGWITNSQVVVVNERCQS